MTSFTSEQKLKRRKKILIKNTIFAYIGYCNTQLATLIAKLIGTTSIKYEVIIFLVATTSLVTIIFTVFVKAAKNITIRYANTLFFTQFVIWVLLYGIWVFYLNEIRVIALFFALSALLFLISNSNFVQSLAITIGASVLHISASYFGIYHLGQGGSFKMEMLYLGCFLPASLFICYIADQFNKQKNEIKHAKINAEKARDALWGEMELAKKIQTVLLPEKPSIEGYEIAAHMAPADEVGGDYYDVISVEGKDWIIIGDVSGHGVPAGLVMMMTQTSIKVVLAQHPDMDPSKLLTIINEVISSNITRLGEDKYMTITVFAAFEKGKFYFSGLHQDIMLYRANEKKVELVETSGMWIGIVEDIHGMVQDDSFVMNKNDVMLLYTDGITEAMDKDRKMYSEEKLIEIFENNGHEAPEKIKMSILESLAGYTTNDDITLFLMKRKK